jgi:hypothetical protein
MRANWEIVKQEWVRERSARLRRRTSDELFVRPILDAPPIRARRSTREEIHLKDANFLS